MYDCELCAAAAAGAARRPPPPELADRNGRRRPGPAPAGGGGGGGVSEPARRCQSYLPGLYHPQPDRYPWSGLRNRSRDQLRGWMLHSLRYVQQVRRLGAAVDKFGQPAGLPSQTCRHQSNRRTQTILVPALPLCRRRALTTGATATAMPATTAEATPAGATAHTAASWAYGPPPPVLLPAG